jgi:hypothetical protein
MKDLAALILLLNGTTFQGQKYCFFHHNCNSFSDKIVAVVCGKNIPKPIKNSRPIF